MSERESFLAMIAANPNDDAARLVFADWLDERNDPLGEFIRLQMELEPLRIPSDDPKLEHDRIKRLRRIPPGEDQSRDNWPLAEKLNREKELLEENRDRWLNGLLDQIDADANHFEVEFRKGFPEAVQIGVSGFLKHGKVIRRATPTLQQVILFGTLGRGKELMDCGWLAGLPHLVCAGWLHLADDLAVWNSRHRSISHLKSLTVWTGGVDDCMSVKFGELPSISNLAFVQIWGGFGAENREALDKRSNDLVNTIKEGYPKLQVRLIRPYARRFPLDGIHTGTGVVAGYLPDGQAVSITESRQPVILYFNEEGKFVREEQRDLSDHLRKPFPYSWEECDPQELIEVLRKEMRFQPGPIYIREFSSTLSEVELRCWGIHEEELRQPGIQDPVQSEKIGAELHQWMKWGQSCLSVGNTIYWPDSLGRVQTW